MLLLNNKNYQIFLSTHSVHISESADIKSTIVLGKKDKYTEIYIPSRGLHEEEIKKITRFLDVTRLPILFAKNVILVEGDAELILIPVMLKIKYGIDINKYGISIISMDSCFFDLIAVLFDDFRIKKKCTILTDLDKDYTKEGKYKRRERLSFVRVKKMEKKFNDNRWVKVYSNDYTFEIEFYRENIDILKTLLDRKKYFKNIDKMNNELNSQQESIQYNRIIKICDKAGKGWLAMDLAEYIQKEKVKFKIPDYIIDAIIFIFSDSNYDNCIQRLLKIYSSNNDINFDDLISKKIIIDDKFINFLIDRYEEIRKNDITEVIK